jgi:hypothetical protein
MEVMSNASSQCVSNLVPLLHGLIGGHSGFGLPLAEGDVGPWFRLFQPSAGGGLVPGLPLAIDL